MEAGHTPIDRVAATYAAARVPEQRPQVSLLSGFKSWMRALPHRQTDPVELLNEQPPGSPVQPPGSHTQPPAA